MKTVLKEIKLCINRESKSDELTIQLYSCHDINMNFLAVVTPSSIYQCLQHNTGNFNNLLQQFYYSHPILQLVFIVQPFGYYFHRQFRSRNMVNFVEICFCDEKNELLQMYILEWIAEPFVFHSPTLVIVQCTLFFLIPR